MIGKNWRIDWDKADSDRPDYLPGSAYPTAEAAEKAARELRGLYFLRCIVTKTSTQEDEKLPKRDAKRLKRQQKSKKLFA